MTRYFLQTLLCVTSVCGWVSAAFGQVSTDLRVAPTVWKADLDDSGDWLDTDLWTLGLPDSTLPAYHINDSELRLTGGDATALSLELTRPNGGLSRMTQSGGRLMIEQSLRIVDGVYRQSGGELLAKRLEVGAVGRLDLALRWLQPDDLVGVPLPEEDCVPTVEGNILLWCFSQVTTQREFHLDGGLLEIAGELRLGSAELEVTGGLLRTGSMFVDGFGQGAIAMQSGGAVAIAGDLKIQDGTYQLDGGILTVGRLVMGDPAEQQWLGSLVSRTPAFRQSGGTMQVLGDLELCMPGFMPWIQIDPFTDITYYLDAGRLDVGGNTVVGSLGAAPARFLQSGGTHTTSGTLRIEGEESLYEMTGGKLSVGQLHVGTGEFNEGGTLSLQSSDAVVEVQSGVTLGRLAEIQATQGASLKLLGGSFEIAGDDAGRLAGLGNLSLVIETVDEWATLEAASQDLGNATIGFENNFRFDLLQIGDAESGQLRLVDLFANQAEGATNAIYVNRLIVTDGSILDMGNINLYYREAHISGSVLASTGVMSAVVPEPSSSVLILVALGVWLLGSGRWR